MNKKMFSVVIVLVGALFFVGAGCVKKADAPAGGGLAGLLGGGLTNEDKCVELLAHSLLAPSYGQNMATLLVLQGKIDNLKKQYGWSDEDIAKTCQALYNQNYNQKDFMERIGKRMLEVKSGIK